MGKNKQAQRTKNNARPSNSSRSAELLGAAVPNFVGFSAVKDGGYVPVLPGLSLCSLNEVEMNSVDSNFQVVLKKISKKDATTKYKALQEFATLCQDAELAAVEGMLPFWPRFYCALSIDIEHRVREAAQLAHAAVVKRVGKGIAMYLKQLAGAWFISQYDTYPPAASAATNSFNSTFPPWKIVSAIVHCQCEILLYISNNIIVHTAQTLSTQKSLTNEEMEAKYERVLAANLQGYSYYFKKVPLDEIDKTLEIHNNILSSSRFWKLAKHDALPVKTAFFNVLSSIMENAEKLLQNEKKRTVTTIMNSLDESEPAILSAVWESMLIATTKIDDWHLVVNINKLVLPKLWTVLRSGGQCCASTVYPNLLPFVSQFSKFNINVADLYTNFFNNMRQGFFVKSVQISRSEMLAVTTSFVECLRYTILVNAENVDLCVRLLKEQLMPVIEACLTDSMNISICSAGNQGHQGRYIHIYIYHKAGTTHQYCTSVCQCALGTVECSCLYELFLSNYLKMLSRQFARNVQLRVTTRCFTRSNVIRETNKDKIPAQKSSETDGVIGSRMHRVSDFDKRMLVWVKRYPSVADVPKDVTEDCILSARNKARIKTCNYMIAFTLIGCLISVILGKRDAAKGENLLKQRDDWLRDRLAEDKNK